MRAWSLPPAVRETGKQNAEGLSSAARLREFPQSFGISPVMAKIAHCAMLVA